MSRIMRPITAGIRTRPRNFTPMVQTSDISECDSEEVVRKETIGSVNTQIRDKNHGRLFAIVSLRSHQHKVTDEDLLMIQGDIGAPVGKKIILNKLLLIGSQDFTLIGRPLLPRDLARVEATVVEKAPSETKVRLDFIRRNNHLRYKFANNIHTTIRINRISFINELEKTDDLAGFDGNNALVENLPS
ncbi:RP-L21 [Lepeophtheirus salmonis]|nr:RP-L21 [Lepeophtheirus salmonis]CAF3022705.1 RP-L21 [Lepeophtheirus salmonis]